MGQYLPEAPPVTIDAELQEYLQREFNRISAAITRADEIVLGPTNVAPTKPEEGMILYADGVNFNPGSGEGFYGYINGAWAKLDNLFAAGGLILPSSTNPTPTIEGDARWDSDDNAIVIGNGVDQTIFRSDAWETIAKAQSGSVASLSFTNLSPFNRLRFSFDGLVATNTVNLGVRTSSNNGSSYDSGAADYSVLLAKITNGGAVTGLSSNGNQIFLNGAGLISNAANQRMAGVIQFNAFNKAEWATFFTDFHFTIATTLVYERALYSGQRVQNTARDAFNIFASSGNITLNYHLEGVRG